MLCEVVALTRPKVTVLAKAITLWRNVVVLAAIWCASTLKPFDINIDLFRCSHAKAAKLQKWVLIEKDDSVKYTVRCQMETLRLCWPWPPTNVWQMRHQRLHQQACSNAAIESEKNKSIHQDACWWIENIVRLKQNQLLHFGQFLTRMQCNDIGWH